MPHNSCGLVYRFFALNLAHRARCASAIRAREGADILRQPPPPLLPTPLNAAIARSSFVSLFLQLLHYSTGISHSVRPLTGKDLTTNKNLISNGAIPHRMGKFAVATSDYPKHQHRDDERSQDVTPVGLLLVSILLTKSLIDFTRFWKPEWVTEPFPQRDAAA